MKFVLCRVMLIVRMCRLICLRCEMLMVLDISLVNMVNFFWVVVICGEVCVSEVSSGCVWLLRVVNECMKVLCVRS